MEWKSKRKLRGKPNQAELSWVAQRERVENAKENLISSHSRKLFRMEKKAWKAYSTFACSSQKKSIFRSWFFNKKRRRRKNWRRKKLLTKLLTQFSQPFLLCWAFNRIVCTRSLVRLCNLDEAIRSCSNYFTHHRKEAFSRGFNFRKPRNGLKAFHAYISNELPVSTHPCSCCFH